MKHFYCLFAALLLIPSMAFAQLENACDADDPTVGFKVGKLTVFNPPAVAGNYIAGVPSADATWPDTSGLLPPGASGDLVLVQDPGNDDDAPNLGCTAFSNADEMAGKIAFVSRGDCNFSLKALNAQNAGALGAVIYNNDTAAPDTVLDMAGGDFGVEVQIATLFISRNNGLTILEQLVDFEETVSVNLGYDDCYLPKGTASEDAGVVDSRELSAAYPNPFASRTQFDLAVEETQNVSVRVFNVLGQEVATLHEGALPTGVTHTFTFEGADLPAGVYLYRVVGETFASTRQVTLVR